MPGGSVGPPSGAAEPSSLCPPSAPRTYSGVRLSDTQGGPRALPLMALPSPARTTAEKPCLTPTPDSCSPRHAPPSFWVGTGHTGLDG